MPAYNFKIDLLHSEPLVTRTFRVSSESSLYLLHQIIQVVMGWRNSHLYEFSIDTLRFMDTRLVDEDFEDVTDVKSVMVEDVFPRVGAKAHYLYDFGDGWMHQLELMNINHLPQNELLPSFISAQNSCPPEDCGGIHRYLEMIEIVKDPTHAEYANIIEFLGPKFNPANLNRIAIFKALGNLRPFIKDYEQRLR